MNDSMNDNSVRSVKHPATTAAGIAVMTAVCIAVMTLTVLSCSITARAAHVNETVNITSGRNELVDQGTCIWIDGVPVGADGTISFEEAAIHTFTFQAMFTRTISRVTINGTDYNVTDIGEGKYTASNVPDAAAYNIAVIAADDGTRTIIWTYNPGHPDDNEILVRGATITVLSITRGGANVDFPDPTPQNGGDIYWVQCMVGDVVTLKLEPVHGYQLKTLSLNGVPATALDSVSTFRITIGAGNLHFAAIFEPNPDSVTGSAGVVSGGTLTNVSDNVCSSGNINMNISAVDDPTDVSGYVTDYIDEVQDVDLTLEHQVWKGNSNDKWTDSTGLSDLASPVTVGLSVPNNLQAGETYGVVRNHNGTLSELTNAVYNSSTQVLRFDSDGFSTYTIVKKAGTPETNAAADPTQRRSAVNPYLLNFLPRTYTAHAHTHDYEWRTIRTASEDEDGIYAYVCKTCGSVKESIPVSAYATFNYNTMNKIRSAAQNATVEITTKRWISFHRMVMDALAERPDVTLKVNFLSGGYKGEPCSFTIPAGTDITPLIDSNGYSGFLFLLGK